MQAWILLMEGRSSLMSFIGSAPRKNLALFYRNILSIGFPYLVTVSEVYALIFWSYYTSLSAIHIYQSFPFMIYSRIVINILPKALKPDPSIIPQ